MAVQNYNKVFRYGEKHKELLGIFSNQVGLVIERKKSLDAIKSSERDYRELFESANDAIVIFEPENEIVLDANKKACEIYEIDKDELIGKSLVDFSVQIKEGKKRIKQTLRVRKDLIFKTRQISNKGKRILFEINASVINYQGVKAILSINRDITEQYRNENV